MLRKTRASSKDSHGMQFYYYKFVTIEKTGQRHSIHYEDAHNFGIKTKSLRELKQKIGKL